MMRGWAWFLGEILHGFCSWLPLSSASNGKLSLFLRGYFCIVFAAGCYFGFASGRGSALRFFWIITEMTWMHRWPIKAANVAMLLMRYQSSLSPLWFDVNQANPISFIWLLAHFKTPLSPPFPLNKSWNLSTFMPKSIITACFYSFHPSTASPKLS